MLDCFCHFQLPQVSYFRNLKQKYEDKRETRMINNYICSLFFDRPLRGAAGGVFLCRADQRRAEGAHPQAGARPEHHPGHVLPAAPRRRRVGGWGHGEHPGANQRGHCDVRWYVSGLKKQS